MVVECIDDITRLRAVKPEWDGLWRRSAPATPFQHSGWLIPWWECFGSGRLFSFAVWDRGALAALALMFLHPWGGRRQVTFLGNGVSDYLDILAEQPEEHVTLILRTVSEQIDTWDLCDLQDLPDCSALLRADIPAGLESEICPQYICSSVSLPESWEVYSSGLPHGLKRNLRRYRNQLECIGTVSLESATDATLTEYLDSLFGLHRARWAMKNEDGMLDGPAKERFHMLAAKQLWAEGLVRLHGIRLDGALVAIVYALVRGRNAYSYLGGFSPAIRRCSPGSLILEYTIQQAIREGVTRLDFLRGEESYKADWGAIQTTSRRLLLRHLPRPTQ